MIAAIYARKSTNQRLADEEARSVARQTANARAFAKTNGWRVLDAWVLGDDAISGAETKKLVNRQRLIDVIASGRAPFQVLIMRDDSRFSREDGEEAFGELKRLAQTGIEIWFYQDGKRFTFGTFGDNVVGFVRAEMNAEFRRQISRFTKEAMVRKAQAGHVTGGRVFGYDNVCSACARVIPPAQARCCLQARTERRINDTQAAVVKRIFVLSAAGTGYTRIAKLLNAEQAPAPRPQQARPAAWSPSSVYEVLHRPLYRGEVVWNKTKKRGNDGRTAVTSRPETEWFRLDMPELRIVPEKLWSEAHRRLDRARAEYDRVTRGHRRLHRDRDSKYLLPGFARCSLCGGGLHIRSRSHGRQRAFFYACTSHYNRGPEVCPHVDQWPMEELDREVLDTLAETVLSPDLVADVTKAAKRRFDADPKDEHERLRAELDALERQQSRLVDAVATGGEAIPAIMTRLRAIEAKRRDVLAELERTPTSAPRPAWTDVEAQIRRRLMDWKSVLTGDIARARQALRELLTTPIKFTPTTERGYRAIRFEGRWGLHAIFGGELVTNLASPPGGALDYEPTFQGVWRSDRPAA